jgi:hypothetical protein
MCRHICKLEDCSDYLITVFALLYAGHNLFDGIRFAVESAQL